MTRKTHILFIALLTTCSLAAQKVKELFSTDEVLEMTLTLDTKEVYNDVDERKLHAAAISWTDSEGRGSDLPVKVQIRGKTRAMKATCKIPPLILNFKDVETKGSPFHKQKKIKLVTHCKDSRSFQDYVKKEYLTYRIYNLITPYSLKTRLCRITYVNSKKPADSSTHYGFLLEPVKDLAKRNDMKEYDGLIRNQEALDKDNIDKLVLFQFMIGNLDWSVPDRHNIKIMLKEGGSLPVAVPYDFDYSGLVDTPYATPPDGMDIDDVKSRIFRGLCRDQGYADQIQFFKSIQPKILDEIKNATYMEEKSRSEASSYINGFYKTLNDPSAVTKQIDQACRAKHKHSYEY